MSTIDALSSVQAAAAAQAASSSQTEAVSDEVFSSLLSSMLGTSEATSQSQYLLSGLMDGSIQVNDSSRLVSALLSTTGGESGGNELLSGLDTSLMSQDTITALLDLAQTNEENWLTQLLDSLKTDEAAEEEENDAMLDYYKAMSALGDAQKNILI